MISYELAKQLKDAGFPFIPVQKDREIVTGKTQIYLAFAFGGKEFYAPTLSELIEACGDDDLSFQRISGQWIAECWYIPVLSRPIKMLKAGQHKGSTTEEAVAKLFIALHEKETHKEA